jgi:hypothetical protein
LLFCGLLVCRFLFVPFLALPILFHIEDVTENIFVLENPTALALDFALA